MFSKNQSPITTIQTTTKGIEHGTFNLRVCIATHLIWWPFHECKAARNIKELDNSGRSEFKKKIKHKYIFKSQTLLKFWRSIQKLKKKTPKQNLKPRFFFFWNSWTKKWKPRAIFQNVNIFCMQIFYENARIFQHSQKNQKANTFKKTKKWIWDFFQKGIYFETPEQNLKHDFFYVSIFLNRFF